MYSESINIWKANNPVSKAAVMRAAPVNFEPFFCSTFTEKNTAVLINVQSSESIEMIGLINSVNNNTKDVINPLTDISNSKVVIFFKMRMFYLFRIKVTKKQ